MALALSEHLERTSGHLDVTTLFNREGFTALTFAASQSKLGACNSIISFIKQKQNEASFDMNDASSSNTNSDNAIT